LESYVGQESENCGWVKENRNWKLENRKLKMEKEHKDRFRLRSRLRKKGTGKRK